MFDEEVQPAKEHGGASPYTAGAASSPSSRQQQDSDCCSVLSFYLRGFLYLCAGVSSAVAAGAMNSLDKKFSGGCIYNHKHPTKSGNCDFILYTHAACCCVGFVFLLVTVLNVTRSDFRRSKFVGFELVLSVVAFILIISAVGILTTNLKKLCENKPLHTCVENLEDAEETSARYILMSSFGTWLAAPVWLSLIIILYLRLRRALNKPRADSFEFNNPVIT